MKRRWYRQKSKSDHADDWLMTYADMITLLLCFFAVFLFATLAVNKLSTTQEATDSKADVQTVSVDAVLPETKEPAVPPEVASLQDVPPQPTFTGNLPFHDPSEDMAESDSEPLVQEQQDSPREPVAMTRHEIVMPELPPPPESNSDKITVMEMDSSTFFSSGSATLSGTGKAVLKGVLEKIKSDQFKDYQVTVEGHTDDTPIKTPLFPSNWELSTARASAVVHYFLEQGVVPQRLRAAGYADTFPKVSNLDNQGKPLPENRAKNRRVVIKLERIEKGAYTN